MNTPSTPELQVGPAVSHREPPLRELVAEVDDAAHPTRDRVCLLQPMLAGVARPSAQIGGAL